MQWLYKNLPENIYSLEDIRKIERGCGIKESDLMQSAAKAACDYITREYGADRKVLILVGPGNNGGDGKVLAGMLAHSEVAEFSSITGGKALDLSDNPVLVDAIFGIGLARDIVGGVKQVIEQVNSYDGPVVALDLPSGLDTVTGKVHAIAVKADATVTFLALKEGLFSGDAKDYVGKIIYSDLGIKAAEFQKYEPAMHLLDIDRLSAKLPARSSDSSKGTYGHLLVIGGGKGMAGAVILAGEAALRSGCGKVTIATHPDNLAAITRARPELMTISVEAAADLDVILSKVDSIVIGPGLGMDSWAKQLVSKVVGLDIRKVIDADALNIIAADKSIKAASAVLTPHPGEAARLLDISTSQVQRDRKAALRQIASTYQSVTLLKGSGSLIAAPDGVISICPYGNDGMATAGMGDVLSGIAGGTLASYPDLHLCICYAVAKHALAGDMALDKHSKAALIAGDLYEYL